MRLSCSAAAALGALLAGLLSGCAGAGATVQPSVTPSASAPAAAAVDLLPTVWHVHDAAGAGDRTWLLFRDGDVTVFEPGGFVLGGWTAQRGAFLVDLWGWSGRLHVSRVPSIPWLTAAVRLVRTDDGFALLGARGEQLARLTDDGPAPRDPDALTTPEPVTPADRALVADATPGPGTRDLPADALVGRWGVPGIPVSYSSLTVDQDGAWRVHGQCGEGTGTGGDGRLRLAEGGALLLIEGPQAADGCATVARVPADAAALGRFGETRSVALDGDRLTLFDAAGHRIGTLARLR